MNNQPEKEVIQAEESSTIFSAPTEHKTVTPKPKKKRGKTVMALVLAVAILCGATWAVVEFIPEKEEHTLSSDSIPVLYQETEDVEKMTVENKNGKFEFYTKEEESTNSETGETVTDTVWYLKGYDKEMIDSDLIYSLVVAATDIEAIREITEKTAEQCGLKKPTAKAHFTTADKTSETVLIGGKSPDNAGVYVKLASKDNIYLVADELDETFGFEDLDLASSAEQGAVMLDEKYADYCSGVAVTKSDYVTVEGVNFPEKMVFRPTADDKIAAFIPYEVIEPTVRDAQNVETLFLVFTGGFNTSGAYSFDVKDSTIKALGLDKPDFVLSAIFDDYTYSYKFKQQEDGDYAVVGNDSKNVKKVTVSDCGFLNYTTTDFYSSTIFMTSIDEISNLTIETVDKTYVFDIEEDPNGDDTNKYIVECDGKRFKSSYFQSFYQYLCSLQSIDFESENITAEPELTITYNYIDKDVKPVEISFVKESAVRYQYSKNGVPMGKVGSSDYTKIHKNLERLLEGKQVVVN